MILKMIQDCEAKVKKRLDWVDSLTQEERKHYGVTLNINVDVNTIEMREGLASDPLSECPTYILRYNERDLWEDAKWGYAWGDVRVAKYIEGVYTFINFARYPLRASYESNEGYPSAVTALSCGKVTSLNFPTKDDLDAFDDPKTETEKFWECYETCRDVGKQILLRDWLPHLG